MKKRTKIICLVASLLLLAIWGMPKVVNAVETNRYQETRIDSGKMWEQGNHHYQSNTTHHHGGTPSTCHNW